MSPISRSDTVRRHFGKAKDIIYDDDKCLAYDDEENPVALVHFLVVPKTNVSRLCKNSKEEDKLLGHMLLVAKNLALQRGLNTTGYHVMVDEDPKRSKLKSIHISNRSLQHMLWPIGPGSRL